MPLATCQERRSHPAPYALLHWSATRPPATGSSFRLPWMLRQHCVAGVRRATDNRPIRSWMLERDGSDRFRCLWRGDPPRETRPCGPRHCRAGAGLGRPHRRSPALPTSVTAPAAPPMGSRSYFVAPPEPSIVESGTRIRKFRVSIRFLGILACSRKHAAFAYLMPGTVAWSRCRLGNHTNTKEA